MPITFPTAHVPVDFIRKASRLLPPTRPKWFGLIAPPKPRIDFDHPQKVFTASSTDIIKHELLSAAEFIGWRYFVLGPEDEVLGELDVEETESAGQGELEPVAFFKSPFASESASLLRSPQELLSLPSDDFEARFLRISPLSFVAIWLHGSEDTIVPVGQAPPGLESGKAYSESEVIQALEPIAKKKLEFAASQMRAH